MPVRWLDEPLVLALHERVIERFGGSQGILSRPLLSSALHRPLHRSLYDSRADEFDLAAEYGFGIIKNHPFVDGNKRTAMLLMAVFLIQAGREFDPDDDDAVRIALGIANDEVDETALAEWLRDSTR